MNMLEDTDGYMYRYYKSCDAQEKKLSVRGHSM